MLINIVKNLDKKYDGAIAFKYEDAELNLPKEFDSVIDFIKKAGEKAEFKGKSGENTSITLDMEGEVFEFTLIGLGKKEEADSFKFRQNAFKGLKANKGKEIVIIADSLMCPKALFETVLISDYKFDKYISKKEKKSEKNKIDVYGDFYENILEEAKITVEATKLTRDLVNEPANVIYPETLAEEAVKVGQKYGFEVEVFDDEKIEELGMKAFMSVAKAADARPRLIVMRYMGAGKDEEILGLIGKGLTYDTGGLSLKPSASMDTMKSDMAGAATVIGTMTAIARQKLKKNVVAVVAACENSLGGNAYRPGDVIESMAGKTIEVLNTDAEGRLTLIDAIHYAIEKEKADKLIDIATLTGAVMVALGETTTGALSNNDDFYSSLEKSAKASDERLWRLPNFPEYSKLIESKIADFKNIGGKWGGSITAGIFLEKFVQEKPWIHLDIAGTSWTDNPYDYYTYGGTGQMLRTLVHFIKNN
jgi:leucyl aminopeptidase